MNEEQKIRKLTWKYFWQQKWSEIKERSELFIFLGIVASIFGWVYLLLFHELWAYIIAGLVILFFLWLWINSNWKKAISRAKEDME